MTKNLGRSPHKKENKGSVDNSIEPSFLIIGQIAKPHGVRGEVKVFPHTDVPQRFGWLDFVYVGKSNPQKIEVEGVRFHKNAVLLKLKGYDTRDAVSSLRAQWVQIPESEAIPLQDGEYFLYQLIGIEVVTDEGESLGTLKRVIETGANNVFEIKGARGDILLPDIEEVVLDIDFDEGRMLVHLLPGLL